HAPAFMLVVPVVEASFARIETANVGERWKRTRHEKSSGVVIRVRAHVVLAEFRDHVLTVRGFIRDGWNVRIDPSQLLPSALSSHLQAGASMESDHYISTQRLSLLRLPHSQTFSCCRHQHDGHYAPGNTEHR